MFFLAKKCSSENFSFFRHISKVSAMQCFVCLHRAVDGIYCSECGISRRKSEMLWLLSFETRNVEPNNQKYKNCKDLITPLTPKEAENIRKALGMVHRLPLY
jgi:hypothetical protein